MDKAKKFGILTLVAAAFAGIVNHFLAKSDDAPAEEVIESVMESQIENVLGLPPGSKRGQIDLTPESLEKKYNGAF